MTTLSVPIAKSHHQLLFIRRILTISFQLFRLISSNNLNDCLDCRNYRAGKIKLMSTNISRCNITFNTGSIKANLIVITMVRIAIVGEISVWFKDNYNTVIKPK